jgi:protein-tyrosine phosphatase
MISGFALENLERCRYPGTGYVLIEFFPGITWMETLLQIRRLLRRGYRPLLAHPERYHWCRRRSDRLVKLSRMGCGALVSARSFQSRKHAPEARRLLEGGFAHGLCSDAHGHRDTILGEELRKRLGPDLHVPWEVYTGELPSMVLEDLSLPELPLRKEDW